MTTFLLTWVALDIAKQLYATARRCQLRWIARKRGRAVVGSDEFDACLAREARIVAHLRKLNISSKDEVTLDELSDIAFRLIALLETQRGPDAIRQTLDQLRADRAAGMPETARFSRFSSIELDAMEYVLAWLVEGREA